jgi:hypothetical protein
LADYTEELTTFPASAQADQVDFTSQFLSWARSRMATPVFVNIGGKT